ncbi:NTP transferase domain-containing protein [Streptomyces sp. NPDC088794]|uniref:NTP transferase domain-containing protein n=1 Tax=Streptomyces sp. NPDC088794 TaxID=3365902 RepID=UPI00382826F1
MTSYEPPGRPGADPAYDAVVLAGGAARRLGGADKPGVRVGGRALLDRVLAACADARTTVVVADVRPTARPVLWAREEPPGGGPVAALAAGLAHTMAEHVVVLSADLPFLEPTTVQRLLAVLRAGGTEGALLTDTDGRDQPLVAAYRADALHRELAALAGAGVSGSGAPNARSAGVGPAGPDPSTGPVTSARSAAPSGSPPSTDCTSTDLTSTDSTATDPTPLTGLPLRRLVSGLRLTRVPDPVASFDCDTWDDIAAARARIREHGHVLDEWISAVKDELGLDLDVDTGVLLDLARDAAHGVARPAAPLTTFLVGYAAAQAGGGPEAVAEAARKAAALALRWAEEDDSEARPAPDAG